MRRVVEILISITLFASNCHVFAQTGSISGVVKDELTLSFLSGIEVRLQGPGNFDETEVTFNGQFDFNLLDSGEYTLSVSDPDHDYDPKSEYFLIQPGDDEVTSILLYPRIIKFEITEISVTNANQSTVLYDENSVGLNQMDEYLVDVDDELIFHFNIKNTGTIASEATLRTWAENLNVEPNNIKTTKLLLFPGSIWFISV